METLFDSEWSLWGPGEAAAFGLLDNNGWISKPGEELLADGIKSEAGNEDLWAPLVDLVDGHNREHITALSLLRIPDEQDLAFGSIQQGSDCIDTLGHLVDGTVGLYACHNSGGNQEWAFTKDGFIKHSDLCLTLTEPDAGSQLKLHLCQNITSQKWIRVEGYRMLKHRDYDLCIDSKDWKSRGLTVRKCVSTSLTQRWKFSLNKL